MDISILMSVYIKEKTEYLDEAIDSIINQTYKPKQIVIIKDGKLTPELDDVIEKYRSRFPEMIEVYSLEKNMGLGLALKFGIEKCKCEYIARMDSDDVSREDRLEKQIRYLEKNTKIDILGGYMQEYNHTMKKKISIKKVPLKHEEIYNQIGKKSPFNHSSVVLRKKAILEAGNYRNYNIEDYDLWIRMRMKNMNMENLDDILVNYRTSYYMYKRRTGLKYLKGIIEIEKELLKYKIIDKAQYKKNIMMRTILALVPARIKMILYPKLIRKIK